MDAELFELQRQFEFAQQAKSSIRLSERNVVELVQKLQHLQLIDLDLLHTVSGKEYITQERLRQEILGEIKKKGRVSLIDLADMTAVDLYHVENQVNAVVIDGSGLMLVQGEVISESYWDNVAEEINERLQECSQISLAELATQLHVGSELIASVLEHRLGTTVKGRLEGGQLYTPAYIAHVNAMVRGAARGITVPTNLTTLWTSLLQLLQDGANGVAVESAFFQSLFNGLVKEGEIHGSLCAGAHWTPTVFAIAQKECVDFFFSQSSFISYEVLHKLGISQPNQYLQSRYSEGIPLATVFVRPSLVEMLDSAAEDAINNGSWFASHSVFPTSFSIQDANEILSHCPSVQLAVKANKALVLGESYVFSNAFIKDLFSRMEKEMGVLILLGSSGNTLQGESKVGHCSGNLMELNEVSDESGRSRKKKGKFVGNTRKAGIESGQDNYESFCTKSKKNQRKAKEASLLQVPDFKASLKKDRDKKKEDGFNISEECVMQKINELVPDFQEEELVDSEIILRSLANYMRPMLHNSWKERQKTLFTDNAERAKHLLDSLQKKLCESFLNMKLYEKALDLFEDDEATSVILHRHLLRTTAVSIVDMLLHDLDIHNKLKNGVTVEEALNHEYVSLGPGERLNIVRSFPGCLSVKALAVVEALEGKRVETFMTALRDVAEESALLLKKFDKKLERTLLHSYRKDLTSQVSAETDPVSLLPKVVSLLYLQIHNKALQAPGRAISFAVSRLKKQMHNISLHNYPGVGTVGSCGVDCVGGARVRFRGRPLTRFSGDKLDDSAYKVLMEYHTATVTFLALLSAATDDEQDCTSDRIASKRQLLENLMPLLKGLVLSAPQP